MLIDEQNKKGGVLARSSRRRRRPRLELATVRREGSAAAGEGQGIGSIRLLDLGIGKSVLRCSKRTMSAVLPVQYEGEESSKNVF